MSHPGHTSETTGQSVCNDIFIIARSVLLHNFSPAYFQPILIVQSTSFVVARQRLFPLKCLTLLLWGKYDARATSQKDGADLFLAVAQFLRHTTVVDSMPATLKCSDLGIDTDVDLQGMPK